VLQVESALALGKLAQLGAQGADAVVEGEALLQQALPFGAASVQFRLRVLNLRADTLQLGVHGGALGRDLRLLLLQGVQPLSAAVLALAQFVQGAPLRFLLAVQFALAVLQMLQAGASVGEGAQAGVQRALELLLLGFQRDEVGCGVRLQGRLQCGELRVGALQ
jgi:hypothetical protein